MAIFSEQIEPAFRAASPTESPEAPSLDAAWGLGHRQRHSSIGRADEGNSLHMTRLSTPLPSVAVKELK